MIENSGTNESADARTPVEGGPDGAADSTAD
jgi:hypothetical protein